MADERRAQETTSVRGERGGLTLGALLGGVLLTGLAILGGWIALTPHLYPARFDTYALELTAIAGGTLLVTGAIGAGVWGVRTQRALDGGDHAEVAASISRANIEGYLATFNEGVKRAEGSDPSSIANRTDFIKGVRSDFETLLAKVSADNDAEVNQILEDSAEELERLRAYIIPTNEILADGQTKLADMYEWGVPSTVLDKLTEETVPMLKGTNNARARAALRTVYENYDYWDDYVEEHAIWMRFAGGLMLALMLVSLTGAVMLVHVGHVYSGAFCGGVAGALLSVVAKLPPVLGYGATNAYVARIMSRVGVGVAASMIGIGLLASDIITIHVPVGDDRSITFADMLDGKDRKKAKPAPAAAPAPPANDDVPTGPYTRRSVLLILAVAMLFGFSERALSTFEDRVLPARVVVAEEGQRTRDGDGRGPKKNGGADDEEGDDAEEPVAPAPTPTPTPPPTPTPTPPPTPTPTPAKPA
ncbi:MAG TPA: hypothetical protein VM261_36280 [Kofleriaceae bacterium]|nr:hypothetical protein [Kofleriaceae bacterium]